MLKNRFFFIGLISIPLCLLAWGRDRDVFRSLQLRAKIERYLYLDDACRRAGLGIASYWYKSRILSMGGDAQRILLAMLADPKEEPRLRKYAARALALLNMRSAASCLDGLRSYSDSYGRGLASWTLSKFNEARTYRAKRM